MLSLIVYLWQLFCSHLFCLFYRYKIRVDLILRLDYSYLILCRHQLAYTLIASLLCTYCLQSNLALLFFVPVINF